MTSWTTSFDVLAASRRLDWRFLSSEPNIGSVAVVGPSEGELAEALRALAGGPVGGANDAATADLVVVTDPAAIDFVTLSQLVRGAAPVVIEATTRRARCASGNGPTPPASRPTTAT